MKISICFRLLMLFSIYLRTFISMSIRLEGDEGVMGWYFGNWLFSWCCFGFYCLFQWWHCFIPKRSIMLKGQLEQQRLLRSFKKSDALLEPMLFRWFPFAFALAKRVKTGDWAARTTLHSQDSSLSYNISWIRANWWEVILLFFSTFFRSPKQF